MLLKRFVPVRAENGSALVAVLGVFAMGLILTTLIVSSVVQGLGFSTYSRASVQSQAAADAGITAARTSLYYAAECNARSGVYVSTSSPNYRATVERNNGAGWVAGCPTALTSQVRITSTGTAAAPAVSGVSAGDSSTVEAVYDYLTPGVNPSGVAMYMHDGVEFESNSSFDLSEGGAAGLIVKKGDVNCLKNNSVINGSLIIDGDLTFGGSCTVTGSAVVSGKTILGSKGRIDGNLTSGSVSPNPPGSRVGGVYSQSSAIPAIPEWTNLTYEPLDWRTTAGLPFDVRPMIVGCTLSAGNLGGIIPGHPVIINALSPVSCPAGIKIAGTISLTSDVVIFANKWNIEGSNAIDFRSANSASHRLWLITPDKGPAGDNEPTCGGDQGNFSPKNNAVIDPLISALLYTPCAFAPMNNFSWNGQMYVGDLSGVKNNSTFTFLPVGAAGVDFDQASEPSQVSKPQPGSLILMRNLSNG